MRRTEAREYLMQLFFQMDMQNDFAWERKDQFIKHYLADSDKLEYFEQVFTMAMEHREEIDNMIEAYSSEKWRLTRLAKVDLAILRVSLAEILYIDDVPSSVAINEAVEMGKKFGGDESAKFINGLLGKISRRNDTNHEPEQQ